MMSDLKVSIKNLEAIRDQLRQIQESKESWKGYEPPHLEPLPMRLHRAKIKARLISDLGVADLCDALEQAIELLWHSEMCMDTREWEGQKWRRRMREFLEEFGRPPVPDDGEQS